MIWLLTFTTLAAMLVVLGGFVRLTQSGLSIVEWRPVAGAIPPLSEDAWRTEFEKYQRSPEFRQINREMSLGAYKEIFLIEWAHRLLARLAGLVFALPLVIFSLVRKIPIRESSVYILMGFLFLSQALMGWIMVASGLYERPSVSHYFLAAHLLLALSLIGIALWTALGHLYGFQPHRARARWSSASRMVLFAILGLLVQMAYGAFVAGLRAGSVSDTWPLMLGRWIPAALLGQLQPPALNLVAAPLTVAFIHRWLAIIVLGLALFAAYFVGRRAPERELRRGLRWLAALTIVQVGLGIGVVISGVNITAALLHQANALALFALAVFMLHRLRSRDAASSAPAMGPA